MKTSHFWWCVRLLPFIVVICFVIYHWGTTTSDYMGIEAFLTDIEVTSESIRFPFIANTLTDALNATNITYYTSATSIAINFASYEIFVLLLQVLYEVLAFLPKLCIKVMNKEKEKYKK